MKKHQSGKASSRAKQGGQRQRPPQFGRRAPSRPASTGASRTLQGVLSANRGGFGFVRSEELTESIFLPPRE